MTCVTEMRRSAWSDHSDCVVSGAMYWVLRITKIFGVAPLQFHKERAGWRIRVSPKHFIFDCVSNVVLNVSAFAGLLSLQYFGFNYDPFTLLPSVIIKIFFAAALIFLALSAIISVFGAKSRMRDIIKCLDCVKQIKAAMKVQNKEMAVEKSLYLGIAIFCLVSLYLMIIRFITKPRGDIKIGVLLHVFLDEYVHTKIQSLTLQFIYVTVEVHSALKHFNNRLLLIYLSMKTSSIEKDNKSDRTAENISSLTKIYPSVPEMLEHLDNSFGLTTVLQTIICLLHMVVSTYLLLIISKSKEEHLVSDLVCLLSFIFIYFMINIVLMETYHRLIREKKRTRSLVGSLLSECSHERVHEQLDKLQLCLRLSDVTPSTTKLCSLSRVQMIEKCSNVAAYVLMLITIQNYNN